ncbi:MAG: rhamnogalacturonan acetylesterase [Pseudomonadota bacterium]
MRLTRTSPRTRVALVPLLLASLATALAGCVPSADSGGEVGTGGVSPGASGGATASGTGGAAAASGSGGTPSGSGGVNGTGGEAPNGSGGAPADAGTGTDAGLGTDAGTGSGGRGGGTGGGAGPGGSGTVGGRGGTAAGGRGGSGGGSGGGGATAGTGGRVGSGGAAGAAGADGPVTVFIAGDSTVSNYSANAANKQAGWGQMLPEYFNAQVKVSNQSIGGRTSRRFINEGRLTTILNAMKPGDYLLVQFGTNDGNPTAMYDDGEPYMVSTADFQMYMGQYIDGARAKQGIPILVTPPPRASCSGDSHSFGNGLLGFSNAMKTVAMAKSAAVIDLNADTVAYINMIGCVAAKANFFLLNDGTHFQQMGARLMAGFVADGVVDLGLPLAAYRLP